MIGGEGNDVYKVDNANDLIIEEADYQDDLGIWTTAVSTASTRRSASTWRQRREPDAGEHRQHHAAGQRRQLRHRQRTRQRTDRQQRQQPAGRPRRQRQHERRPGQRQLHRRTGGDVITELSGQGTDLVRSTLASFDLGTGSNLENLTLEVGAVNGTGNELANVITGNDADNSLVGAAGDDTIDGGKGADTMVGGTGDDDYYVDSAGDSIVELGGEGHDAVFVDYRDGAAWSNVFRFILPANVEDAFFSFVSLGQLTELIGNGLANLLQGNDGSNLLDGGAGNDSMAGGKGDDIYVVGEAGDQVTEGGDEGDDTVQATINLTLGANLENLVLTGGANAGTGNALGNIITGNAGLANVLNGGAGADTLVGGALGDTYYVDTSMDALLEGANGGVDQVVATGNYALGANLENLNLAGIDNINGYGNGLDNLIGGNNGNNLIDGGTGNDTASYAGAVAGVNANLGTGQATGGGGTDTLISVENLAGSAFGDNFTGNNGINVLRRWRRCRHHGGRPRAATCITSTMPTTRWSRPTTSAQGGGVGAFDLSIYAGVSDTVNASISYSLGGFIENLQLLGPSDLVGTGNALRNGIAGNDGNNTLRASVTSTPSAADSATTRSTAAPGTICSMAAPATIASTAARASTRRCSP
jgi:Ca2+-binding RTX toxin-like protein